MISKMHNGAGITEDLLIVIREVVKEKLHRPLSPDALKNFFESNLDLKRFYEVNRITVRNGTGHDMSGIIIFGEKDPEATLK